MVAPVEQAWLRFYAAAHLLDAIEDGEDLPFGIDLPAEGINLAFGLIFSAENELSDLEDSGVAFGCARYIRKEFQRSLLSMLGGQKMGLYQKEMSLETTWQMARLKSGAFFSLGCTAGARFGTHSPKILDGMARFGEALGLLVQLGDDVKDLWGNEKGKGDLAAGCWGIPLAYAFEVLPSETKIRLGGLLQCAGQDTEKEVEVRTNILSSGALTYASLETSRLRLVGERALCSVCPPSAARTALLQLLARKGVGKGRIMDKEVS